MEKTEGVVREFANGDVMEVPGTPVPRNDVYIEIYKCLISKLL